MKNFLISALFLSTIINGSNKATEEKLRKLQTRHTQLINIVLNQHSKPTEAHKKELQDTEKIINAIKNEQKASRESSQSGSNPAWKKANKKYKPLQQNNRWENDLPINTRWNNNK